MTAPVNRQAVERDWASRGFSCDLWTDPPGQVWADFVHSVDELVMPMEGRLEIEMEGKTFHPEAGEEILIPAKVTHTVKNIGDRTAHWLYGYKSG